MYYKILQFSNKYDSTVARTQIGKDFIASSAL